VTYREAPIREPIAPPWGRFRGMGRRLAYSIFASGGVGVVALLALGDPIMALAAALSSSGFGLSVLFGAGGPAADPTPKTTTGPEEPLRRAGLSPVGWTEWRAEREGFPARVLYSALSARVRIEVALGTAPPFAFEVDAPASVESSGEVVGPVRVRSDAMEIARSVVSSALRKVPEVPDAFSLRLDGRVLKTSIARAAAPSGYESVLAALDYTLGIAQAMASLGQGLPPFRRG
jgi:hypothetical protein